MAQITFNLDDTLRTSTYTAYVSATNVKSVSVPSTSKSDAQNITVPAHSAINWVKIYCSLTSPAHGTLIRNVLEGADIADALFENGSTLDKTLFAAGTRSIYFWFKSNTSGTNYPAHIPGQVTSLVNSSQLNITNIRIVIDYNPPNSTVTLNKTSCPAGGIVRANISAASSAYTHKVYFSMTGVTTIEYTLAAGVTYKDFTIPLDWQIAIPSNVSRVITCTLKTYSGATKMGDDDTDTVTMTLSDDAYPVLGTVTAALDLNGLPGTFTKHIQNKTKLLVTLADETLAYESPIADSRNVTINGVTMSADAVNLDALFDPIALSGDVPINAVITDGRGRTGSKSITVHIEPYSAPSLTGIEAYRADDAGAADDAGTYIFLQATGVCSSIEGENAVTLQGRYGIVGGAYGAWSDMTGGTAIKSVLLGGALAVNVSYNAQIKAVDTVGTEYIYTALIPQETVTLNFKEGGSGAAFGGYADAADLLKVVWSKMTLGGDPVCAIEVGQLYITKDSTDPATKWPGTTWEALPAGTTIVAGAATGDFIPGDETKGEGGSLTHAHGLSAGYAKISIGASTTALRAAAFTADWEGGRSATLSNGAASSSNAQATALGGSTDAGSSMPPWRAYYAWERLT